MLKCAGTMALMVRMSDDTDFIGCRRGEGGASTCTGAVRDRCHVTKMKELYRHPGATVRWQKYRSYCYNAEVTNKRWKPTMLEHIFHLAVTDIVSYRIGTVSASSCLYAHIYVHNIINNTVTLRITSTFGSQEWGFKIIHNIRRIHRHQHAFTDDAGILVILSKLI